jgi:hypothetical protein
MADIKSINTNDPLIWYRESVRYSLDTGSAPGLRGQRDALLHHAQTQQLAALDQEALDLILELDNVDADLLQDDDSQPLQNWWWHLGKLRNRAYPADLLPAHLRAVYQSAANDRA